MVEKRFQKNGGKRAKNRRLDPDAIEEQENSNHDCNQAGQLPLAQEQAEGRTGSRLSSPLEMSYLLVPDSQELSLQFSEDEEESSTDSEAWAEFFVMHEKQFAAEAAERERASEFALSALLAETLRQPNDHDADSCKEESGQDGKGTEKVAQSLVRRGTIDIMQHFHTLSTSMDDLLVSPEEEWQLAFISGWMRANCLGEMSASESSSSHSLSQLTPSLGRGSSVSPEKEVVLKAVQSSKSQEVDGLSPIRDADLQKRFRLVDECLARTLRVLLDRSRFAEDQLFSGHENLTKQNGTCKLSTSPQTPAIEYLPQTGLKSKSDSSPCVSTRSRTRQSNEQLQMADVRSTNIESSKQESLCQNSIGSQELILSSQTSSADRPPQPEQKSAIDVSPGVPTRARRRVNGPALKSVRKEAQVRVKKEVDTGENLPMFSPKKRADGKRASKSKRPVVAIVVDAPKSSQAQKITCGLLATEEVIKNTYMRRMFKTNQPMSKIKDSVSDVSDTCSEITNTLKPKPLGQVVKSDSVSLEGNALPSTTPDSRNGKIGKKTFHVTKSKSQDLTKKRKLFCGDDSEISPSTPSRTRSRRSSLTSESAKASSLSMRQRETSENQSVTANESQGFIPSAGGEFEDLSESEGCLLNVTQKFIPCLSDDVDDPQTQSGW